MNQVETLVVDYGVGNPLNVCRALEAVGAKAVRSRDPREIEKANRIVVPGVGAFGACIQRLRDFELLQPLVDYLTLAKPYLGICVGMQMLLEVSEEFGEHRGLAAIPGRVVSVPEVGSDGTRHKIPNIGWRALLKPEGDRAWDGTILSDIREGELVYFLHSFMAAPEDAGYQLAEIDYDGQIICAAVHKDAAFGCQFHPEKSGPAGLTILRSFLAV